MGEETLTPDADDGILMVRNVQTGQMMEFSPTFHLIHATQSMRRGTYGQLPPHLQLVRVKKPGAIGAEPTVDWRANLAQAAEAVQTLGRRPRRPAGAPGESTETKVPATETMTQKP